MALATVEARGGHAAHLDAARLGEFVLLRIAAAPEGISEAALSRDLQPYVGQVVRNAEWRLLLARLIGSLAADGLVVRVRDALMPSAAGQQRTSPLIGAVCGAREIWASLRDGPLIAWALGFEPTTRRLRQLGKPDGLKAAVVESAWSLNIKGSATPARLREALALVALERAFGNQVKSGLGSGGSMSAKAGRLLAGQLSTEPRSFGTDARLVAGLAQEALGIKSMTLPALRLAVLRRYLTMPEADVAASPLARPRSEPVRSLPNNSDRPAPPSTVPVDGRPDPTGFAHAILAIGRPMAEGWEGNRKVFISRVWETVQQVHPRWGLSEIEFKCMLTEAHRLGLLTLANSDLKDKRHLKELQDSATAYKNTVWHYVRISD